MLITMKQVLTAKLKLETSPDQFAALRRTQLAYRDALNDVSVYAFEHGKMSNAEKLQKACYRSIREAYHLPSQMACNVPRQVAASYKGLWTKAKQNKQHRQAGITKKRYKGLDKPPKYISPTLTYSYGRDYGFKHNQQVSVLTLDGRLSLSYEGYTPHVALIQHSEPNSIGAAKLWYDARCKQLYLLVSLAVSVSELTPHEYTSIVGVDVGRRYVEVETTLKGACHFESGRAVTHRAEHYVWVRTQLQHKGTRSATRRLRLVSGRERRFKLNVNHVIAKRLIARHPRALIGLEHLIHIRERTRCKTGKRASGKQRRANRRQSTWSFAELQALIAYKAVLNGSLAVKVDADYTSQRCPQCGHTTRDNRPNKGLLFVCQHCAHTLHADLIGARNIALRTLLIRQDWVSTGSLSACPDVSNGEAKAARLKRYAELRWSSDTSPAP
jgi:putative transposase